MLAMRGVSAGQEPHWDNGIQAGGPCFISFCTSGESSTELRFLAFTGASSPATTFLFRRPRRGACASSLAGCSSSRSSSSTSELSPARPAGMTSSSESIASEAQGPRALELAPALRLRGEQLSKTIFVCAVLAGAFSWTWTGCWNLWKFHCSGTSRFGGSQRAPASPFSDADCSSHVDADMHHPVRVVFGAEITKQVVSFSFTMFRGSQY